MRQRKMQGRGKETGWGWPEEGVIAVHARPRVSYLGHGPPKKKQALHKARPALGEGSPSHGHEAPDESPFAPIVQYSRCASPLSVSVTV